jgi:ABC-2 type transport system permease protein
MTSSHYHPTGVRRFGRVNWLGLWTLYKKEVRRFLKVGTQTVAAPVVSTLLFLMIFKLALGAARPDVNGIPFADFLAPGLIMMAILTNAFANSSSSLIMAKVQGTVVDILMPPLSPWELTFGFIAGAATRGLMVALATGLAMIPFVSFPMVHPWAVLFFAMMASVLLSSVGILAGIWADKFDHLSAVTNFLITPLIFLSGTFYSVKILPGFFFAASQANPFFYLIDGFRYGVIGQADSDILVGAIGLLVLNTLCILWCYFLFRTGYKLKT